jgi:diacylglycerol kinase family enzyme
MTNALLVANTQSGTNALTPKEVDRLAAVLRARGIDVETFASRPLGEQIARTASADYDMVVVAGGDGTVRSVAEATVAAPKPIAILPYGTMNMLAKELGLPLDPDAALALIGGGHSTTKLVDIGLADGKVFLHSAMMGLPVRAGTHRERQRGVLAFFGKVWIGLHMLATLRRDQKLTLAKIAGPRNPPGEVAATSIVALVGEPSTELLPVPRRARVDAGYLTIFAITADSTPDVIRSILHEAVGTLDEDENIHVVRAPSAVVAGPRRKMHALLDGERQMFASPLSLEIRAQAQPMIVPSRGAGTEAGG